MTPILLHTSISRSTLAPVLNDLFMQAIRLKHVYRVQAYSLYRIPGTPKAISFFQAAGGHEAIHGFPLPHMCIAFCSAHGIQQLRSQHALCAKQSLAIFNSCVSATLVPFQGYRCKERNGIHMLAFHSVRCCCTCTVAASCSVHQGSYLSRWLFLRL